MCWHLFKQKWRIISVLLDSKAHKSWTARAWNSVFHYRADEENIRTFKTPTLVITGEDGGMIPLSYSWRIYEQLAAPVKKFEAGHMMMIKHVNRSLPAITNWLQQFKT